MSDVRPDPKLLEALAKISQRYLGTLDQAQAAGRFPAEDRSGVMASSLLRAVDRIAALPDDRDLTPAEQDLFKASLIQVAVAAICLIDETPSEGLAVMVAAFDMGSAH